MKHFQYSVMGHGVLLRSLGWATKISGEISSFPPAHPSSYFMTSPLAELQHLGGNITSLNIKYGSQFAMASFKCLNSHWGT